MKATDIKANYRSRRNPRPAPPSAMMPPDPSKPKARLAAKPLAPAVDHAAIGAVTGAAAIAVVVNMQGRLRHAVRCSMVECRHTPRKPSHIPCAKRERRRLY